MYRRARVRDNEAKRWRRTMQPRERCAFEPGVDVEPNDGGLGARRGSEYIGDVVPVEENAGDCRENIRKHEE
jgi:hypothetical protein